MSDSETGVAGIILAAGASARMGRPKQLLPVRDGTLLGLVIKETLGSDLDKVVLVLGHEDEKIREFLSPIIQHPKLEVVKNRRHRQGISSSIIAGLSALEDTYDHIMILLADMPYNNSGLINLLLYRYLESRLPLGAVKVKEKRSHPVIFSRRIYRELHLLRGDVGARDLFLKYEDQVCLVEPENPFDDRDINTPEDYTRYQDSLEEG